MDTKRIVLYLLLFLCIWTLWDLWQQDYRKSVISNTVGKTSASTYSDNGVPVISADSVTASPLASQHDVDSKKIPDARLVQVHTDRLNVTIDTLGGNIIQVDLVDYPENLGQKNIPFTFLSPNTKDFYIAQSGLTGATGPDTLDGLAQYRVVKKSYQLAQGQDVLDVDLYWTNNKGVAVNKTFKFYRGDYKVKVDYTINNKGSAPWDGHLFAQLKRKWVPEKNKSLFHINPFTGVAVSTKEKPFAKFSFPDLGKTPINQQVSGGWVAMMQHYFVSAWIPEQGQQTQFFSKKNDGDVYTVGFWGPQLVVEPGQSLSTSASLYAGPKVVADLGQVAPHLELTIDFGWLWPISLALFWLMKNIHQFIGNWGWSIVLVTVLIKLSFYRLSAASYRSMARMRSMQPKMLALKERFGHDKQKLSQATMELYKTEKINPLGGCLPMLIQIPVFIALYWVLLESVELRQAPFVLWIHDLAVADPFYILPVLFGLSMLAQQKLSPPPADPVQAKVMMFLPIILTVFFMTFPAGLVLYWVVNNTLSIMQQWYITRKFVDIKTTK